MVRRTSLLETDQFRVTRKTSSYSIGKTAVKITFADDSGNLLANCEAKKGETQIIVFAEGGEELLRLDRIHSSEPTPSDANGIFDETGKQLAVLKGEKTGSLGSPKFSWVRDGIILMAYAHSRNKINLLRENNTKAAIQIKGLFPPRTFEVSVVHESTREDRILIVGMIIMLQAIFM